MNKTVKYREQPADQFAGHEKNILVIERNTRDSLTNLLTAEGYSICLTETAGAGLEAQDHSLGCS